MTGHKAIIGLGGNIGDVLDSFRFGLDCLHADPATRVTRASPLYRTPAWGLEEQPDFLNACAELETWLSPHELLSLLQSVEDMRGRKRCEMWGPRTLDLDLLIYGEQQIDTNNLTVPHPLITERAFVLKPLAYLTPGMILGAKTAKHHLQVLSSEEQKMKLVSDDTWWMVS